MPLISFASYLHELSIRKPDPKASLGIPRKKMPQLKSNEYPELIAFMRKNGIGHRRVSVSPKDLKPVQKEFSDHGVTKAIDLQTHKKEIIISQDNYVIDGNHRWLAALNTKQESLDAIQFNGDVKKVMNTIVLFHGVTYKDIY